MKCFAVATAAFASLALAAPAAEQQLDSRQAYVPCTGLYGSQQCCATGVLGVADLDCGSPPNPFETAGELSEVCAAIGQRARCCVLPIASFPSPPLYATCTRVQCINMTISSALASCARRLLAFRVEGGTS
ncbi:uncharacterized protein PG986_008122 [Apiospora aurea]|uniref:Hydrophobin n=1 Tax=Apiospora aurea TaxID=335848 RepID=A0ABR1QES1_9PEZI